MDVAGVDTAVWRQRAWLNRLQTLLLLLFMGGFLALLGGLIWGSGGVLMLLAMGIIGVALNPGLSPRWVMKLYGAVPIRPEQARGLWDLCYRLAQRAGLPAVPALYYVPSSLLNAFAVGTRDRSAIAVTDGLLRRLDRRELAGVLGHEISHVRNNDLWVMGLADLFSRATSLLSLMGQLLLLVNLPLMLLSGAHFSWLVVLLLVFAPHLSALAQLALSRSREYDADLNAVALTGDPRGLAAALAKIEQVQGTWLERILMPGRRIPEPSLLRTHPDTRDRIARLHELEPASVADDEFRHPVSAYERQDTFGRPVARRPRWHASGLWY